MKNDHPLPRRSYRSVGPAVCRTGPERLQVPLGKRDLPGPVFILCLLAAPLVVGADWPTYRGNPQRTGNTDGLAGPAVPRVLWVQRSQEHFIASPVPAGDQL